LSAQSLVEEYLSRGSTNTQIPRYVCVARTLLSILLLIARIHNPDVDVDANIVKFANILDNHIQTQVVK